MIYAVLDKEVNGVRAVTQLLDIDERFNSIAELQQLPAFVDISIDFTMADIVEIPEGDDVGFGHEYDTANNHFALAPEPRNPVITKLQLLRRLNDQEKLLLFMPDKVPNLPDEVKIMLTIFAEEIKVATNINLDDDEIVTGLATLEAGGLIGEGRANAIRGVDE